MKKILNLSIMLIIGLVATAALASCNDMPVGFLRTEGAQFVPDSLNVYHNPDPTSTRAKENLPWVSNRIQGVAGTNPINYELSDVTATQGGNAEKMKELANKRLLIVDGGLIVLLQEGAKQLPTGRYKLSLRVYNDGHSQTISDVYTIIVAENEIEPTHP